LLHCYTVIVLQDRTHTADCCPQTSDEMDILESTDSDKPESVFCGVMDSSSHTEEELYESEMVIRGFIT